MLLFLWFFSINTPSNKRPASRRAFIRDKLQYACWTPVKKKQSINWVFLYFIKQKGNLRHTPFLNFNVTVGNVFFCLTSLFSKSPKNRLLFVMKINFAGTTSPTSRCRFPVVNAFILFPGSSLMKWKHKLKWKKIWP